MAAEVMQSTKRVRRGWLERLFGYRRVFETEITDGEHTVYARGPTPEASQVSAQRAWEANVGEKSDQGQ